MERVARTSLYQRIKCHGKGRQISLPTKVPIESQMFTRISPPQSHQKSCTKPALYSRSCRVRREKNRCFTWCYKLDTIGSRILKAALWGDKKVTIYFRELLGVRFHRSKYCHRYINLPIIAINLKITKFLNDPKGKSCQWKITGEVLCNNKRVNLTRRRDEPINELIVLRLF